MGRNGTGLFHVSRRRLLMAGSAFGGAALGGKVPAILAAPAVITSDRERPQIPCGVMSGDPTGGRAIVWSKTDRPARMLLNMRRERIFKARNGLPDLRHWRFRITARGSIWDGSRRTRRFFIASSSRISPI
jgi:hypothetical protein